MSTVSAIMAGEAIQLATRLELRRQLTKASTTPITIAAGTPRNITPTKMKTSPAVKLEVVLGMRIGFDPARTTRASNPANPAIWLGARLKQPTTAHPNTIAPAKTMTLQ